MVTVQFSQSVFSVFENDSQMMITLNVSHPALTEFSVIVVASPDTADGKHTLLHSSHSIVHKCT